MRQTKIIITHTHTHTIHPVCSSPKTKMYMHYRFFGITFIYLNCSRRKQTTSERVLACVHCRALLVCVCVFCARTRARSSGGPWRRTFSAPRCARVRSVNKCVNISINRFEQKRSVCNDRWRNLNPCAQDAPAHANRRRRSSADDCHVIKRLRKELRACVRRHGPFARNHCYTNTNNTDHTTSE